MKLSEQMENFVKLMEEEVTTELIKPLLGKELWYGNQCMGKALGVKSFIKRVKSLEKENKELKQQIEKMECCGNCKYYLFKYFNNINICEFDLHDYSNYELKETDYDYKCDKWELEDETN